MFNKDLFDRWSITYERTIHEDSKGYPFEGYYDTLRYVQNLVTFEKNLDILDIGIGTGLLSYPLYEKGAHIYGLDFSHKMLKTVKNKMPQGHFFCYDIKNGIPDAIKGKKFNYILSSYTLHHLSPKEKIEFFSLLKPLVKKNGKIIIADISFEKREDLENCKKKAGKYWDNEESYIVACDIIAELKKRGINARYMQISTSAGVLVISNP